MHSERVLGKQLTKSQSLHWALYCTHEKGNYANKFELCYFNRKLTDIQQNLKEYIEQKNEFNSKRSRRRWNKIERKTIRNIGLMHQVNLRRPSWVLKIQIHHMVFNWNKITKKMNKLNTKINIQIQNK